MHKVTNFEIALFMVFVGCISYAILKWILPKIIIAIKEEKKQELEIQQQIKSLSEELYALQNQELETFQLDEAELQKEHENNLLHISASSQINLENMKLGAEEELENRIIKEIADKIMNELDYKKIFNQSLQDFKELMKKIKIKPNKS